MLRLRLNWLIPAVLVFLPLLTVAQDQAPGPSEQEKATEREALELLNTIAGSIPNLRSADNRIYLANAVADLLWTRDEKRARDLYETLTKEMATMVAALDPSDQRTQHLLSMIQQQRREIIERMARRDPEVALAFLRSTRPSPELRARGNDYNNEANIELHLAGLIANKDPERALQLARASLSRGLNHSIISVLTQIAPKNPELARTLYGEIVDKLKSSDLSQSHDNVNAAWSLVGSFQPPQADEKAYQSLLELIAASTLALRPDMRGNSIVQSFSGQISSYMPQFEKYAPARAVALRQWTSQLKRTMDPGSAVYQEMNDIMQKGTLDDLLALTSKYPADYHLQIYQQAVYKATSTGDVARARQIINEMVKDVSQRQQMLDQLENQLFWTSVNENRVAEARQTMQRIKNPEQRFQLLMGLISNLANRKEHNNEMSALLSEALTLIESLPMNSSRLAARMQVALAYSSIDPRQSVALLQSVITLSNELVAAAAVLDGFENNYLKEGEWMKRGYSSLSHVVNNIQQNLGQLAKVDPAGARTLSEQIQRPEIRLMAQLEIAKNLLSRGPGNQPYGQIITVYPMRRHLHD